MIEAVVLAGGLGTRLRSTVPDLPKPMAPVAGRPFLERLLERWIGQGVRRFVLSVGYRHELISAHFGASYLGADIDYEVEQTPLGTGGALLLAARRLRGAADFLAMNGDTWLEVECQSFAAFHRERRADVSIAVLRNTDSQRYAGVELDAARRVTGFGVRGATEINGGVYLLAPGIIERAGFEAGAHCSLESDLLPRLVAGGAGVHAFACEGRFIDIGVPEDYRRAADIMGN